MRYPVLTGFLFLLVACNGRQQKVKPVLEKITESVYASGLIKSSNQYEVFSAVSGIVEKKMVKEGDVVSKKDAILYISGVRPQLQAENAHIAADNASQAANFRKLEELRLSINDAKIKMDQDALQLQRQQRLWAQQIGSRSELEQRELAWKTSCNNYETARLRYAELQRDISFNEKQALKNLEISRSLASDYTVKSEYSGKVYDMLIEEGEMVNLQQPVAVIGDAASFLLELQVDEYDIVRIKPQQRVIISMDSYKGQVFDAMVTKVTPFMHERSKTFTVEARFLKAPPVLYPNLTCEANIIVAEKAQALIIPRSYLLNEGFVLLTNNERKKVSTGLMDYEKVEIISGLTVNDLIIKPAP
ncbi:efflux RND transporter periplasmic adaptor subunit [Chitinophaga ginsengisoli]|uniref:Multidrug efflux pump subunit AcrA (Membrane-fusion protein) n=1 Tax=Chitinophaga ginsengisoli TaxID=363837 RepID=A0A2P8GL06_9BACT|nr:efflux RND transporter periplasmic adaptor subunit [Chitinophaga ginsengisoli]PSL34657.1 multidrug efflux pump subunit AcrA (membrane-fusion protein) [Chitinophaga ginsengisoli]